MPTRWRCPTICWSIPHSRHCGPSFARTADDNASAVAQKHFLFYLRPFLAVMEVDKKKLLETLHRKMIEEIQDYAIILMDVDGTILSWNKGVGQIKGYTADEIIGKNFRLFYLPE